jgi:hypothetical protein
MGVIQNSINQVIGLASIYRHLNKRAGSSASKAPDGPKQATSTAASTSIQDEMKKAVAERSKAQKATAIAQRDELKAAYKAVQNYPVMGEPIKNLDKDFAAKVLKADTKLQDLVKATMTKE